MKRLTASALILILLLSFAACLGGSGGETTTLPGEDASPTDETTTLPGGDASPTDETATLPGETTLPGGTTLPGETTTAVSAQGLNSTDAAEVIAFYSAAAKATQKPAARQYMKLDELEGGSGFVGAALNLFDGIAKKALEKNSTAVDSIPGTVDLLTAADLTSAKAVSNGRTTTVTMKLKEQTDSPKETGSNGPVGHAIGTLGDIDRALNELSGVSVDYSEGTLSLKYYDAYVTCEIDNATGKITDGTWHHKVYVSIDNVKAKLSIFKLTLNGAHGIIDYKVEL